MPEQNRQIADLVDALHDVELALADVNVQIARREERGNALAARVTEMQGTLRDLGCELRDAGKQHVGHTHGLQILDAAVSRLQADVVHLRTVLDARPDTVSRSEFHALSLIVSNMDGNVARILRALKLDADEEALPGLAAQVRGNRAILMKLAAVGAGIIIVTGLVLGLLKATALLQGFLAP